MYQLIIIDLEVVHVCTSRVLPLPRGLILRWIASYVLPRYTCIFIFMVDQLTICLILLSRGDDDATIDGDSGSGNGSFNFDWATADLQMRAASATQRTRTAAARPPIQADTNHITRCRAEYSGI